MALINMTRHARCRAQQRGINDKAIELLISFGHSVPVGRSCQRIYFRKSCLRELADEIGIKPSMIERLRHIYAVVADDGSIVTVAHFH